MTVTTASANPGGAGVLGLDAGGGGAAVGVGGAEAAGTDLPAVAGGVGDDVGDQRVVDPLGGRRLERRADDGEEGDHGNADHQRRGGGRGATRVAYRVLTRQRAGDAAPGGDRPAQGADDGPHQDGP